MVNRGLTPLCPSCMAEFTKQQSQDISSVGWLLKMSVANPVSTRTKEKICKNCAKAESVSHAQEVSFTMAYKFVISEWKLNMRLPNNFAYSVIDISCGGFKQWENEFNHRWQLGE